MKQFFLSPSAAALLLAIGAVTCSCQSGTPERPAALVKLAKRPHLSIPAKMLDAAAPKIRWSYWHEDEDLQREIRISLSGKTVFRGYVGATPGNPADFQHTSLKAGEYDLTVEDQKTGEKATVRFDSRQTRHIWLHFSPLEIRVNTEGHFEFI